MWIMSTLGFYSIVKKAGTFQVRGRVRWDLENLVEATGIDVDIQESRQSDYRYRLLLSARQLAVVFSALSKTTDYPNFKNKIATTSHQRGKLEEYYRIWSIMQQFQPKGR